MSIRRNMMPVLTGAGRSVMKTFSPVWMPTPVARMTFLRVRWFIIMGLLKVLKTDGILAQEDLSS